MTCILGRDYFYWSSVKSELMSVTYSVQFSSSVVSDSLRPYGPQHANASLSITNLQSFLKLMFIELVMPFNHLLLCCLLLLPLSIFSSIRVFSNGSVLRIRWPEVLELQLQHQSFQWTSGLISFRIDWFDLLAIQRTLESFLQHHSSKASILWCSAFFIVQLSQWYMTTGKP